MTQISIFDPIEPEFSARIRRAEHNGETHYSLVDIMAEFSDTVAAARFYWRDTKKRLEKDGFDVCEKISHISMTDKTGKRKQKTDVATAETCLRIVQSIPSPKAEPIRQWLAKVAHERLQETANPALGIERAQDRAVEAYKQRGKDEQWIASRLHGIAERKAFTDALSQCVYDITSANYGQASNGVYRGLWGRDAATLKEEMKLPKNANLRDSQPRLALHYTAIAEEVIAYKLGDEQTVSWQQAAEIIRIVATAVGVQAAQIGTLIGLDIATGKPLLTA